MCVPCCADRSAEVLPRACLMYCSDYCQHEMRTNEAFDSKYVITAQSRPLRIVSLRVRLYASWTYRLKPARHQRAHNDASYLARSYLAHIPLEPMPRPCHRVSTLLRRRLPRHTRARQRQATGTVGRSRPARAISGEVVYLGPQANRLTTS